MHVFLMDGAHKTILLKVQIYCVTDTGCEIAHPHRKLNVP